MVVVATVTVVVEVEGAAEEAAAEAARVPASVVELVRVDGTPHSVGQA